MPAVMNAGVRNAATRCAVIQSVGDRVARGAVRNAVTRCAVTRCAATPIVVTQAATGDFPNAAVLSEVLNVVQDDARVVAIQCAVVQSAEIQCAACLYVRYAVDQRVVDRDALVDFQAEVLPNVGQGVSPVDLLSQAAVQSEVASDAAPFSVPRPACSLVAQCAAPQD